jgi:hypothetical protein
VFKMSIVSHFRKVKSTGSCGGFNCIVKWLSRQSANRPQ